MAYAEQTSGPRRVGLDSTLLAAEWRRLRRAATAVALFTSPMFFVVLYDRLGLSVGWALLATALSVIAFRGLIDVASRRLLPWPSMYGVETAVDTLVYRAPEIERVARKAFWLARRRRKKVTSVDKSNVLENSQLWRRVVIEVAREFPDVELDHLLVDNCAMQLVLNPRQFDILLTENLFGDILTDLGAAIQGGMGSAASGNIHPGRVSMFEPIHGSAPDIAGKGIASPIGAILSAALLLEYVGEARAARRIEDGVQTLLASRRVPSVDATSGLCTSAVGDLVVEAIKDDGRMTSDE